LLRSVKRRTEERTKTQEDAFRYGEEVVNTDIFREAMMQTHHNKTTVGEHSANVAVTALLLCRRFNRVIHPDERRLVLAAFSHDLGIVGRHEKYAGNLETYFRHPKDSARIAMDLLPGMNMKFYRSISRHMFPLTPVPPTSWEGIIISAADKWVSIKDLMRRREQPVV